MSIKNHDIFKMPFRVWLLKSSFSRIDGAFEYVLKDDLLVVLRSWNYVYSKIYVWQQIDKTSVVDGGCTIACQVNNSYKRIISTNIHQDFNIGKPIAGFEVINLRTSDKLWISWYDMEVLVSYLGKSYFS